MIGTIPVKCDPVPIVGANSPGKVLLATPCTGSGLI